MFPIHFLTPLGGVIKNRSFKRGFLLLHFFEIRVHHVVVGFAAAARAGLGPGIRAGSAGTGALLGGLGVHLLGQFMGGGGQLLGQSRLISAASVVSMAFFSRSMAPSISDFNPLSTLSPSSFTVFSVE